MTAPTSSHNHPTPTAVGSLVGVGICQTERGSGVFVGGYQVAARRKGTEQILLGSTIELFSSDIDADTYATGKSIENSVALLNRSKLTPDTGHAARPRAPRCVEVSNCAEILGRIRTCRNWFSVRNPYIRGQCDDFSGKSLV